MLKISTVASQEEEHPGLGPLCVEFACSPYVSVGSLQVLPQSKNVRRIANFKLVVSTMVANGGLSLYATLQ